MDDNKLTERILDKLDGLEGAVRELAVAAANRAAMLDALQAKLAGYSRPCPELASHLETHEQWRLRMSAVVIGALLSMAAGIAGGIVLAKLV